MLEHLLARRHAPRLVPWDALRHPGQPAGVMIEHRNGDGLVNHRRNLRVATGARNSCDRRTPVDAKWPGYKSVTWDRRGAGRKAAIWHDGKSRHLGDFPTQEEAAMPYDRAAARASGEFACPNFRLAG